MTDLIDMIIEISFEIYLIKYLVVSYYVCNLKNKFLPIHYFELYIFVFTQDLSILIEKEIVGIILRF